MSVNHKPWTHIYDKWSEFTDAVKTSVPNKIVERPTSRTDESAQHIPWSGIETWEKALKLLDVGWTDGISKIRDIQRLVPPDLFNSIMPVEAYKPEMHHNIAGGALDIGTFITGATPNNFVTLQSNVEGEKQQGKKLITVYLNITNSSYCDSSAFLYRGTYAFTLVEHLENCGYSVELWVVAYQLDSYGNGEKLRVYVKVKEFGEMFDGNKLALTLCSPMMLRRYIFAVEETYSNEEAAIANYNYGRPVENAPLHDVVLPSDMDLNPLWIPMVNISTPDGTLKEYKSILEKYLKGGCLVE